MKILLIYLPFCTPASPPYSLTHLAAFLKANSDTEIEVLDLNIEFHKLKFPEFQQYYKKGDFEDYEKKTKEYQTLTSKCYSENNNKVVHGEKPEFFDELLNMIKEKGADIVAFSIVYSSQSFYAYSLLKELKNTVIGGPAVNEKLISLANNHFKNEVEFLEFIGNKKIDHDKLNFDFVLDFSIYNLNDYFTPKPVIPIKTSSTCFYKQCAFCAHYAKVPYFEYPLENIKKTIEYSKQKYFFFIDDMIPSKRLLDIAKKLKPLNINWCVHLKPTKDFTYDILKELRESGLTMIMWGVESGNQRVLNAIGKGTKLEDVKKVLENSHNAGIRNVTYIMFGFPTETKEEFMQTIEFLEENKENIDLVSPTIFGLQLGAPIYDKPSEFGVEIFEEKRTILEPKITYSVKEGLSHEEVVKLKEKNKNRIEKINKFPKGMNFFREHMLILAD